MSRREAVRPFDAEAARPGDGAVELKLLVGSGDRISLLLAPFLVAGGVSNVCYPAFFSVGGPSTVLRVLALGLLAPGVTIWLWSIALILTRVPRHQLITSGPYAFVKHPLYTSVALLVLPSLGILLDSWLGVVLGGILYAGSRLFSPDEEKSLAESFGLAWDEYCRRVKLPWL